MSLAPASSRGAFLKARLAVNGIQCAARSFGTLTAGLGGLLSSIGDPYGLRVRVGCRPRYQLRRGAETNRSPYGSYSANQGGRDQGPDWARRTPCRLARPLVRTRRMAEKPKKPQKLKARLPRGL